MSHAQQHVSREMQHNKPIIFTTDTCSLASAKGHCCLNGSIKQCTKAQAENKVELGERIEKLCLNHQCIPFRTLLFDLKWPFSLTSEVCFFPKTETVGDRYKAKN